jgi:uncharacterized phage-associated protein
MAYSSLAVANEFIRRAISVQRPVTQMQLQKFVYFAHGWNLAVNSAPLVEDQAEAWQFGPVYRKLYNALRKYGRSPVTEAIKWGDDTPFPFDDAGEAVAALSAQEIEVVEQIWQVYGPYQAFQLSALTHEPNSPWAKVFDDGKNKPIPDEEIEKYFRNFLVAA